MPRKYSVESRKRRSTRSSKWSAWSLAHCNAFMRRSVSSLECLTTRCGLDAVTALQRAMVLTRQAAKQWKKNLSVFAEKAAS